MTPRRRQLCGGDLWALGVVLLELASGHVFQLRRDCLVLGKAACGYAADAATSASRWRAFLASFLVDIVVCACVASVAVCGFCCD